MAKRIIGNLVGTTIPRIKVDEVLDANSNNAVSNKAVVDGINAPKQVVEFANNPLGEMKLVSDGDGLKVVWDWVEGRAESLIATWETDMTFIDFATVAQYAHHDGFGNDIRSTYATKKEVEELDERFSGLDSIVEANENACLETAKKVGDIDTALDRIIEIQNSLIGGDA